MSNPGQYGLAGGVAPTQPQPFGPQASFQAAALRPLFSPPGVGTVDGSRAVFVGDSITIQDAGGDFYFYNTFATHLVRASAGRITWGYNAGRGGQTSTSLIRYLDSEVWAKNPTVVFALIGRNDSSSENQRLPNETFLLAEALRKGCQTRGIPLVLITQPPQGMLAIGTPSAPTLTGFSTGGTLAAGTYGYKVSYQSAIPTETLPSASASVTVTGTTSSVRIDVPVNTASDSYKIYRETTAGSGNYALLTTLSKTGSPPIAPKSYLDTGSVTPSGAVASSDGTASGQSSTVQLKLVAMNVALARYARQYGLLFADLGYTLYDLTTGVYAQGYSSDGTHPTFIASRLMGEAIWAQVGQYFRPSTIVRARSNVDTGNRLSNPLLLNSSGGIPTGWTQKATGGNGVVAPTVGSVAGITGNAFTIALTDGLSSVQWQSNVTTAGSGDSKTTVNSQEIIEWSARIKVTGADVGGGYFYVAITGDNAIIYVNEGFATDASGFISGRFLADGNINMAFLIGLRAGPIQLSVGELCITNVSRMLNLSQG